MKSFKRTIYPQVLSRLKEPRRFMQVFAGPRQVGKTQMARQLMEELKLPHHYATADSPTLRNTVWIEQQWNIARVLSKDHEALLVGGREIKIEKQIVPSPRLWGKARMG